MTLGDVTITCTTTAVLLLLFFPFLPLPVSTNSRVGDKSSLKTTASIFLSHESYTIPLNILAPSFHSFFSPSLYFTYSLFFYQLFKPVRQWSYFSFFSFVLGALG